MTVYNAAGQAVDVLACGLYPAGTHEVVWDAKGLPSGVYFYTLSAGDQSITQKCILLK